jgi:hypothetical protein
MALSRAQLFYDEHIEPSVREWEASPLEPHRAMNGAVALNQMADHFWHEHHGDAARVLHSPSLPAFRNALAAATPEFGLVRDVADAHKHYRLDRANRNLTDASQATAGSMGYGEARWGEGQWGSPPEIVVTYDDGSKHHFSTAVRKVKAMWQGMLA